MKSYYKIDFKKIDPEEFRVDERELQGKAVILVQPQFIGTKWTQANKRFRSSLWTSQGELISASFPKFTNWGENPDNFPVPQTLKNVNLIEKIDGSALIVSKHKDFADTIIRTRGTVDARKLDNGWEIEDLIKKYPKVFNPTTDRYSLIYEWTTPNNQIVIKYSELDITLIGGVYHDDYSLFTQVELDNLAKILEVKRPNIFKFSTIEEMIKTVENLEDREGLCVYSKNDQAIHKIKSSRYLALHRFRSGLSLKSVLEMFVELGRPENFHDEIKLKFDFECWTLAKEHAETVLEADKAVRSHVVDMQKLLSTFADKSRKEMALEIIKMPYPNIGFCLLDGKEINYQKLLSQILNL